MTVTFAEGDGARLRYDLTDITPPWCGGHETILFHHGVGTSLEIWSDWLPSLADRYQLLRFDMRGCGQSTRHPAGFHWSVDRFLDDLLRVADESGVDRFHFVGESFGGTLGVALAARSPDRMLTLTLANAAYRGGLVKNLAGWRDLFEQSTKAWSDRMMEWRFAPEALDPARRDWFSRQQEQSDPTVTLAIADLLARCDFAETLTKIEMPTLLLAPGASPFIPLEVMRSMNARIRESQLRVFEGVRHGLPFSHGRECADVLREFLSRRTRSVQP
jgi:pimeloyl-ACP methyl ester carboxylesterase